MTAVAAPQPAPPPAPPAPARPLSYVFDGRLRVPAGVVDLATFRAWAHSDEFPQEGRIDFLAGEIWVDLSMEQLYTHNLVKTEVTVVVGGLVRAGRLGLFLSDRMRLTHPVAGLSAEPDAAFVSFAALEAGRIREVPRRHGGVLELEGTSDLVVEIVSDSSEKKDFDLLPGLYARAGVPEFWRIDVRRGLRFEVLRLTERGYEAAQEADGWWRSTVFNRAFRLTQGADPRGQPLFTLDTRDPG